MNSFLLALQFLTIIPVNYTFIASDKQLGYSVLFYPVIGLIIGGLLVVLASLLNHLPVNILAGLILILWVGLTGGLHLDGLADCADAWVGGLGNKQRSLKIMKDPAAGPIAVLAVVLLLLLKWTLIVEIINQQQTIPFLLLIPMLGRLAILILMLSTDYIRSAGLGEKLVENLPVTTTKIIGFLGLLIAFYFLNSIAIGLMLSILLLISYQAKKRLGGMTGDVYGAAVEVVEVGLLLGMVI